MHLPQELLQCAPCRCHAHHHEGMYNSLIQLFRWVDEGRHPDAWTSEAFRRVNRANQAVKGKTEDLQAFSCGSACPAWWR